MTDSGDRAMAGNTANGGPMRGSRSRLVAWAVAGLVLVLPLIAMQFTDEVNWNAADFAFAGALLIGVCVLYELAVWTKGDTAYQAAVGLALAAVFLLVWTNAAVGIIGSEDNPLNLMYFGVIAVGLVGAVIVQFRPSGMARTLLAMAVAQVLIAVIALIAGVGLPGNEPLEIVAVNEFFVALFVGSALLFREAGRRSGEGGAV